MSIHDPHMVAGREIATEEHPLGERISLVAPGFSGAAVLENTRNGHGHDGSRMPYRRDNYAACQ